MKTLNIKALLELGGCVVEKFLVEEVGVQVKTRLCRPSCPECGARLKEHSKRRLAIYDLPLADRTTVWLTLPAIQGYCPDYSCFITQRPPEVRPTRNVTWRFMRLLRHGLRSARPPPSRRCFDISESTVRRYELDTLQAEHPEPLLDGIEVMLIDEKAVRNGHATSPSCSTVAPGELLHMALQLLGVYLPAVRLKY